MPRIKINNTIKDEKTKKELLEKLEKIGLNHINEDMNRILSPLNQQDKDDKEFLSRYLLLVAILDQQAETESARSAVIKIYEKYGKGFFMEPRESIDSRLDHVIDLVRDVYRPKARVLRIKKEGVILMRVGGYLLALLSIQRSPGSLVSFLKKFGKPRNMLNGILNDRYLGGLLYEKAARMYVGWATHPHLPVKLLNKNVDAGDIPMVVDGHVAKVFARTGFLEEVLVENEKNMIIRAEDERETIEDEVRKYYQGGDFFMIDYGAFYVGINYCHEKNPRCGSCPLNELCKRNTNIRAY